MADPLARLTARDIMRREYVLIEDSATVSEAAKAMDQSNRGGCIVQNAIGDTVGIFTERDVLRKVVAQGRDPVRLKVTEVMTPELVCAQADDNAVELMSIMLEANFRHLPVMDGRTVIGMVSMKHFCREAMRELVRS